ATRGWRATSVAELLLVLVFGSGQQVEECLETAIERAAKLRDRAVERVERQPGGRAVGELQRSFLDALQRPFRDEANTVDERISRHDRNCTGRVGRAGRGYGG